MTPAEMRERCAVLVEEVRDGAPLQCMADAIRALPVEEAPLTPREKLRRVREAREVLATARVAFVPRGAGFVNDAATSERIGEWRPGRLYALAKLPPMNCDDARTWVLDTLRAEGWDVVEEGEGDG